MVDLKKLDPAVQRTLVESNDLFKNELNKIVDELIEKHGDKQLNTRELIMDVIAPMVGRANINAKLFYLSLLESEKEN